MSPFILCYILLLHFFADFILQSRAVAKNKSTHLNYLAFHIMTQFVVLTVGLLIVSDPFQVVLFGLVNAVAHAVTDWYIWRGYKLLVIWREGYLAQWRAGAIDNVTKYFKYYEDHWFYVTIGLDQLLHVTVLIVSAHYLLS